MKTNQTLSRPTMPKNSRVLRSHATQLETTSSKPTKPKKRRSRADPWAPKRKPNPSSRPRPPPPSHFTCRICIEEQPSTEFVKWVPPNQGRVGPAIEVPFSCIAHLARNPRKRTINPVCKTCIGKSISAKLDTHGVRQVSRGCLEPGCDATWQQQFLMRYLNGEALDKYNVAMFEVWKVDVRPPLVTCVSAICNASGLPDVLAPGFPQVSCHECATRSCAQCKVLWHQGVSCAEYSAKAMNENMTEPDNEILQLMQSKDGRRCPNCQLVIIKDGGCDSM